MAGLTRFMKLASIKHYQFTTPDSVPLKPSFNLANKAKDIAILTYGNSCSKRIQVVSIERSIMFLPVHIKYRRNEIYRPLGILFTANSYLNTPAIVHNNS